MAFRVLLVTVALAACALVAGASTVSLQRVDEIGARIQAVWRVRVLEATRREDRMTLKSGAEGPVTAVHTTYRCAMVAALDGPPEASALKECRLRYSEIVPVEYDEDGKPRMFFSYATPATGIEHGLKTGTEYLACLASYLPGRDEQSLMRAEPVERQAALLAGIWHARAWDLVERTHPEWLSTIEVAGFDAESRQLAVVLARKDGPSALYLVSPARQQLSVADEPLTGAASQVFIDVAARQVLVRLRGGVIRPFWLGKFTVVRG